MWYFDTPIGRLYIQKLTSGRYGFVYDGTVWESCHTPQAEADNVYLHVTGCDDWDLSTLEAPADLSEWEYSPDIH